MKKPAREEKSPKWEPPKLQKLTKEEYEKKLAKAKPKDTPRKTAP